MFDVKDGRILTWSLEAHVVDHCNLRCRHCCSLSPRLERRITPAKELFRDLRAVGHAVRPQLFKITGGEPLLHPDIEGCLRAVRQADIADGIQMTTNGFLIRRMPIGAWPLLDRLVVSHYSSAPLADKLLAYTEERCREHDVVLTVKHIDTFAEMDVPPPGHEDDETIRRVHQDCWLRVRCHMIHGGRFYKCTRPPHIEDVLDQSDFSAPPMASEDGIPLEGDDLPRRIKDYLESDEPLQSCRFCLGASGQDRAHEQLPGPTPQSVIESRTPHPS